MASARSVAEAQACLRHKFYSIVLTDIHLKGSEDLEGLRLIEYVRTACPGTPVVVLTASMDADVHRHARASGVFEVLIKPKPLIEIEATGKSILDEMYGCAPA